MNRIFWQLAFVASLFCMCSKSDKTSPPATVKIDKSKLLGTWSITKGLFNYYDGNEILLRKTGIEKNGLHTDLWDKSTMKVEDGTFSHTGIVAQDHLPTQGKWQILEDGRKLRTNDNTNRWVIDWEVVSYSGSILTIRNRETRNNGGPEKIAEALLELSKE